MKLTFDISATEFVTVRDILADIVPPECRIWVFGSRVKNQVRFNSDLDLALECKDKLPPIILHKLKEAFNDSSLPYRVDVLDINDVSKNFQTIIRPQAIAFPLAQNDKVPVLRFPEFNEEWANDTIINRLAKVIDYRGKAPPKAEVGTPLITARNVRMGYLDFENDEYIDASQYATWMSRGFPKPNDVLFTTEAPLGNVALFPRSGKYAVGQRIITLQTKTSEHDSIFLYQALLGLRLQRKIEARGTGSTAKGAVCKSCFPRNCASRTIMVTISLIGRKGNLQRFLIINNRLRTLLQVQNITTVTRPQS